MYTNSVTSATIHRHCQDDTRAGSVVQLITNLIRSQHKSHTDRTMDLRWLVSCLVKEDDAPRRRRRRREKQCRGVRVSHADHGLHARARCSFFFAWSVANLMRP